MRIIGVRIVRGNYGNADYKSADSRKNLADYQREYKRQHSEKYNARRRAAYRARKGSA